MSQFMGVASIPYNPRTRRHRWDPTASRHMVRCRYCGATILRSQAKRGFGPCYGFPRKGGDL